MSCVPVVNSGVTGVQDYLRGAVSRLASSPSLAQRLGQATADVERAIKSTFEDLCAAESRNGSSSHKLVFLNDWQYVYIYTISAGSSVPTKPLVKSVC